MNPKIVESKDVNPPQEISGADFEDELRVDGYGTVRFYEHKNLIEFDNSMLNATVCDEITVTDETICAIQVCDSTQTKSEWVLLFTQNNSPKYLKTPIIRIPSSFSLSNKLGFSTSESDWEIRIYTAELSPTM
jgi:hypothetical protein